MLAAFRWNLRVLSYVALVVGAFLIYNTISVSVVRRRPEIGIVRALGASRRAVLAAFLGEAACFGVVGALLAIAVGKTDGVRGGAVAGGDGGLAVCEQPSGSVALNCGGGGAGAGDWSGSGDGVGAVPGAGGVAWWHRWKQWRAAQREHVARVHKIRDLWIALGLAVVRGGRIADPGGCGKAAVRLPRGPAADCGASAFAYSCAGRDDGGGQLGVAAETVRSGGAAGVAKPGGIAAADVGAGGSTRNGDRHDDIGGHHGGQFSPDRFWCG